MAGRGRGARLAVAGFEIAVTMFHRIVTVAMTPRRLAKLGFQQRRAGRLPHPDHRADAADPRSGVARQLHDLEVRSLANHGGATQFGLLTDFVDAPSEHSGKRRSSGSGAAIDGIAALNERHGGARFVLLHRRRLWNGEEQKVDGVERKRGKLVELINYLRTGRRGTFSVVIGSESQLRASRFVLTVDADTQLPAGTVQRLAGALAHPSTGRASSLIGSTRVVEGYGVIQPRVEIDLEGAEATTVRTRLFPAAAGSTIRQGGVRDVYQDLFREGNFVGKGILDIRGVRRARWRAASLDNRLLSHDLFEGLFARTALCSDVHVIDEYPTHYLAWMARLHRWTRGDWQIASWLASSVPTRSGGAGRNVLPAYCALEDFRQSPTQPAATVAPRLSWHLPDRRPPVHRGCGCCSGSCPSASPRSSSSRTPRWRGSAASRCARSFMAQRPRLMGLGLRLSLTIRVPRRPSRVARGRDRPDPPPPGRDASGTPRMGARRRRLRPDACAPSASTPMS